MVMYHSGMIAVSVVHTTMMSVYLIMVLNHNATFMELGSMHILEALSWIYCDIHPCSGIEA